MTENDAPESTRARIGFLSIITSSWLPVILAVDGGFPVHAASPPLKVALLSFPRSYGLATDWIGDMATGICNDCQRRQFRRRFRGVVKDSLSLSAVAHIHVQDVRSETNRIGIGVKDSCVWLTSRWTSSRTIVRIREIKQSHPSGCNRYDVWKPFQISVDQLSSASYLRYSCTILIKLAVSLISLVNRA
ncbi:hypothetical protein TNCV_1538811 [Trichonephila clavipes]|nr:hypothetical protein TNCV_1538811 [Trichonephila clavipes]